MKKALVLALLGAMAAGCGVTPNAQSTRLGASTAPAGIQVDNQLLSKLQLRAKAAKLGQPSWKKKISERTMTGQEQGASYADMLKTVFGEGQANKGGGMMEVTVDSLTNTMSMGPNSTFDALFAPTGNFKGLVEVVATDGKITAYDWGFGQTMQYLGMKQAMGEPLMELKSPSDVQSLADLLTKAKMLPMPATIDSANAYLNMMPRRKPDLSIEWFPAYIAVTYEGHYWQGKMVANAQTGDVYFPKP